MNPTKVIIIEDQSQFLKNASEVAAIVIQACITGENKPQFPFYVENINEVPKVVDELINTITGSFSIY